MKKTNPYKIVLFAGSLAFILGLFTPTQTDSNILGMMTYPVTKIFELVTALSLKSSLGNLFAWLILILFFAAPLLVLHYQSKEVCKNHSWKLLLILGFLILISIIHLNGIGSNDPINTGIIRLMEENAIAFSYYFLWIGTLFELYVNIDLMEIRDTNITSIILSLIAFALASSLGFKIGVKLINLRSLGFFGFVDFGVMSLINVTALKLIFNIYDLISKRNFNWFSDQTLEELKVVKKLSNKVIEYAIYLTIFVSLGKLLAIRGNLSIDFNFNIPLVELIVSLTLSLFISVIAQSIVIKKENDSFI